MSTFDNTPRPTNAVRRPGSLRVFATRLRLSFGPVPEICHDQERCREAPDLPLRSIFAKQNRLSLIVRVDFSRYADRSKYASFFVYDVCSSCSGERMGVFRRNHISSEHPGDHTGGQDRCQLGDQPRGKRLRPGRGRRPRRLCDVGRINLRNLARLGRPAQPQSGVSFDGGADRHPPRGWASRPERALNRPAPSRAGWPRRATRGRRRARHAQPTVAERGRRDLLPSRADPHAVARELSVTSPRIAGDAVRSRPTLKLRAPWPAPNRGVSGAVQRPAPGLVLQDRSAAAGLTSNA